MSKCYSIIFILCALGFSAFAQGTVNPVIPADILQLPFSEDFSTGSFETNQWEPESDNWQVDSQIGIYPPCARFMFTPFVENYSSSLTSAWIDASGITEGDVFIEFSLMKDVTVHTMTENFFVEVYYGEEWLPVAGYTNDESTYWEHKKKVIHGAAGHMFKVRFRAEGENSTRIVSWSVDNIQIYRACNEPVNLFAERPSQVQLCDLRLEWESPAAQAPVSGVLSWCYPYNADSVGLTQGGTFALAVRFTPVQLAEYSATSLTKIRLFACEPGGEIVLKVWTGSDADTLVRSQPVATYTSHAWNEYALDEPLPLDVSQELWLGYEVTHGASVSVAGIDDAFEVEGYGNLICLNGTDWETLSYYEVPHNWNIQGFVTNQNGTVKLNSTLPVGYNVYRANTLIGYTTETGYSDNTEEFEYEIDYNVTAVYNTCESAFSNTATANNCHAVSVAGHELPGIQIYPNPASSKITINITGDIRMLYITDITGRQVKQYSVPMVTGNQSIDLRGLNPGIYVVRFVTGDGQSGGRKVVLSGE